MKPLYDHIRPPYHVTRRPPRSVGSIIVNGMALLAWCGFVVLMVFWMAGVVG